MVSLSEMTTFVLLVAVACLHALPDTVPDSCRRGPVVVPVTLLALFTAYLMGTILVYIRVSPANSSVVVSPAAAAVRRFASLACAMACALLLFAMPLVPFRFLTAGW